MTLGFGLVGVVVAESVHVDDARSVVRGDELGGERERSGGALLLPVALMVGCITGIVGRGQLAGEVTTRKHRRADGSFDLTHRSGGIRVGGREARPCRD